MEVNGTKVKLVLARFKRSKTWLADKLEVNRVTIYRWIYTNRIPAVHHDQILKVAKKYEVDITPKDLV